MAVPGARAALFLMESEALALELQGILRSGGIHWTVMLTPCEKAAHAALSAGPLDLAILFPGSGDAIDALIASLQAADTPTILITSPDRGPYPPGISAALTLLNHPVEPAALAASLRQFAAGAWSPAAQAKCA